MAEPRILVVDDDIALCELIREALELEGVLVDEAHHVVEADRLLLEHTPDAVVLDIGLPGIDGLFYTTRLRENLTTRRLPIIAISGSASNEASAMAAGATAFMLKPFDPLELLTPLERAIGVASLTHAFGEDENAVELRRLVDIGRRRNELQAGAYRETLAAIAASLEIHGLDSGAHTRRVSAYAMRLTVEVAPALSDDPGLEWGFMFHDIGNIGVPDQILFKRGSLRNHEWKILQQHTIIGERLLARVPLLEGEGLRVVRSHHERWDGSGYPDGLARRDIPLGARIFAIADALDAMTDRRPYRRPLRWDAAVARIRKEAARQFDPDVVDGLVACEADLIDIRDRFAGNANEPGPEVTALLTAAAE
jgi:response regulator RpfG family c-di-GMP phosphodiesterase